MLSTDTYFNTNVSRKALSYEFLVFRITEITSEHRPRSEDSMNRVYLTSLELAENHAGQEMLW